MPHGIKGKIITIVAAGSLSISSLSVSMVLRNPQLKCRKAEYFEATEERLYRDYRR